ncbi:MAG: flagellar hook-length control protein FliK [Pararhodobacter sp.]
MTQFAGQPGAGVPAGLIPLAMVGANVKAETETALPADPVRVAPGGDGATALPPQALAAQPAPGGGWPMAGLSATVQPVPVGAAPSAPATEATLPLQQPQATIMPRDQMAHWPVVASPPSEPALSINTGSTPFPLPAHAGIAADPVDWRAQQLYAGSVRSLKPAEAVLATGRDDAMLPRAVTVDQAMPAPQLAMPAGAQAVTRQMADTIAQAVQRGQSGQITVHLSPVELGRVEIAMQPREAGMALIILAERPEVLELLRRHIDQLADDMRALGYSDLSFQFGAGTDRRGEAAADPDRTPHLADTGTSAESTPPPETPVAQTRQDGRLDLRY